MAAAGDRLDPTAEERAIIRAAREARRAGIKQADVDRAAAEQLRLIPVDKDHPRILYVTGARPYKDVRVVLRPLSKYETGYVDIERCAEDALDHLIWLPEDTVDLKDSTEDKGSVQLLKHMLRQLVPELRGK